MSKTEPFTYVNSVVLVGAANPHQRLFRTSAANLPQTAFDRKNATTSKNLHFPSSLIILSIKEKNE
ncbi:hypothetical protein POI25_003920 [Salmonella enterica]|nr:hypothetical protein [Salmonella enterica]ECQ6494579.1 hypothetical protein [Salmonella enterica subsp. houtenae]EAX9736502.1 hypothetical protein [Salmonella enterica]EBA6029566.1 hypothetical protein [Salmonella enterica]EBR3396834.1 hypothetical protein [Salmonella enterica]